MSAGLLTQNRLTFGHSPAFDIWKCSRPKPRPYWRTSKKNKTLSKTKTVCVHFEPAPPPRKLRCSGPALWFPIGPTYWGGSIWHQRISTPRHRCNIFFLRHINPLQWRQTQMGKIHTIQASGLRSGTRSRNADRGRRVRIRTASPPTRLVQSAAIEAK